MALETLFLIVVGAGLILPVVAVIAGLSLEIFGEPSGRTHDTARMSRTNFNRLIERDDEKSGFKKFRLF